MDSVLVDAAESVMAITIATLEERVSNHIKFFWVVVAFGFLWLAGLTTILVRVNGAVGRVEIAQANAPARMVAELLSKATPSKEDISVRLAASATILRSSPQGTRKPNPDVLKAVSDQLTKAQDAYADVPEVWQATSAFINYKAEAVLQAPSTVSTTARGVKCTSIIGSLGVMTTGCEVNLEDMDQRVNNNTFNGNPLPFIFINCIVHYRGGMISPKQLIFKNCVLKIDVTAPPSPQATVALRELTTASGQNGDFDLFL